MRVRSESNPHGISYQQADLKTRPSVSDQQISSNVQCAGRRTFRTSYEVHNNVFQISNLHVQHANAMVLNQCSRRKVFAPAKWGVGAAHNAEMPRTRACLLPRSC
jgi:hypothetical protein